MDGLARKYRPKTMSEYMGEGVRNQVLRRFSNSENYPHVVLLHGTRGCGKTSCARLMAMEYLCTNKVDGHACGQCEMCTELIEHLVYGESGTPLAAEVQEIDIASEGSKNNIDEIINDSLVEPVLSEYKILIMDEFHMASKNVQNRLLKIMEEPPKHLVFILCTTDPDKIIDTIHSRCQFKVEVKKAKLDELVDRMLYICKQEKIETSKEALRLIARKNQRIPRDSLSFLEQVAQDNDYKVKLQEVQSALSEVANEVYLDYFRCANKSLEDIMLFISRYKEDASNSPSKFLNGLMQFVVDCVNILYGIDMEEYPKEYTAAVAELMGMYSTGDLDYLLQIVEYASRSIGSSEEKIYLTIITTALRVGKIRKLEDLQNTKEELASDNRRAKKNRSKVVRGKEMKSTMAEPLGMGLLSDVFGQDLVEIVSNKDKEVKTPFKEEDNDIATEEELNDILGDLLTD